VQFRDLRPDDHPTVLALNNAAVPAVSALDADGLVVLLGECSQAIVLETDVGGVSAFCLTLRSGAAYASLNYRWFSERYDDFEYLDRIVVAPGAQGGGIGTAMYAELEARIAGTAPWLLCEVNVRPLNEGSLRFHQRIGFVEVGQQDTDAGTKRVSLLAKPLT
jgi:uncharacterized protein